MSMVKTDSADPVNAGSNFSYTLAVSNAGPSTAQSLTVTDTLPAGVTYVSATGTGWACVEATGTVTCTRASLAVGAAPAITITVTAPAAGGTINNTASVSATTVDLVAGNNSEGESTAVTAQADLSVTLMVDPDPVVGLGSLTYTITVANAGPSTASGVSAVLTLPAGVTFSSATGAGWSCSAPGTVNCSLASLASGASAPPLFVEVTVGPASAILSSIVTVSATSSDPNAANNSVSAETMVIGVPYADLSVALADGGVTVLWEGPLTYTLTVTNGGPDDVTGATVSDSFPAEFLAVSWTCTASGGSSCTAAGSDNINDTVGLLSGGSATYSATGVVAYGTADPLVNAATVSSSIHDPVAANDSATLNTPVDGDLIFKDGFEG